MPKTNPMLLPALVGSIAIGSYMAYTSFAKRQKKKAILRQNSLKERSLLARDDSSAPSSKIVHPHPPSTGEDSSVDFFEGDTVVLEEMSIPSAPGVEEVTSLANGLHVSADVARKLLTDKLPSGWKVCKLVEIEHSEDELLSNDASEVHSVYYFNFETGESSWDHPLVTKYKSEHGADLPSAQTAKTCEIVDDEVTSTAQAILKAFDTNKDGFLSKKEFSAGLKNLVPKSGIGKICVEFFGVNWRAKKEVMSIFNEIDENHDGQLELDEIKHYITRLDESATAQRSLVARRMSTVEDEDVEMALFNKYKSSDGLLFFKDFAHIWKELGSELMGKPFTNSQCNKWAKKTLKKLKNGNPDNGVTLEEFRGLTASGPLFEIVTRRMVH